MSTPAIHEVDNEVEALIFELDANTKMYSSTDQIRRVDQFAQIIAYGELALRSIAKFNQRGWCGYIPSLLIQQIANDLGDPVVYPSSVVTVQGALDVERIWLTTNGYMDCIAT